MADPWDIDWKAQGASAAAPAAATATAEQQPWDVDWSAQKAAPQSGMAMDIAKSAGTGLIKGVEGLAGLPADIQKGLGNLVGKGVLSLGDLIGLSRPSDQTPEDLVTGQHSKVPLAQRYAPTSENIGKAVEKVTGPLHEPETTPGKYAETIAEFTPGALAMGPGEGVAGAAANVGKLAALPGAGSEALGERFQGTWMEPIARMAGALAGGGVGSAGSKVGEMVANRGAASTAAMAAGSDVAPSAIAKVAKNFEADQLTPQAIAQKQADLGPEAMMLDMGRQLQGRAEAIAAQPGKGQNTVLDAVEGRTGTFGSGTAQRVGNTLDQAMGPSQDVVALRNNAVGTINGAIDRFLGPSPDIVASRNAINSATDQIARPLYDQVMNAHDVVQVPESISSRPVVAQAMKDAVSLARNHGEQLTSPTETRTILAGPGYHIADDVAAPAQTSLRYWDYVKKALDSRINGMMKQGGIQDLNSQDKADLGGLMAAKNALVSHLDNVTGGAYGVARRASATKFQVGEAIDLGRSALNTKLLPEELGEHMQGMSMPEQAGIRLGMRRDMQRIIDTAPDDAGAARRMLDTNQNRQKIAQVFGQPAADALDRWTGIHDALDVGRQALNTQQLPEELAQRMQGMSATEQQLTRAGMRREIDRIIDTARNDGAAARRILDTNQNREKIAQVFGRPAADEVDRRIAAETQFQDATNKISANSRTAVRSQLMKDTEAASVAQPPSATVLGLGHAALRRGQQYLGDMSLERTKEGIADLLTRRGTDIPRLAQILAQYSTARAANAATPMSRQAGGLASVIAGQSPGWITGFLPGHRPGDQPSP